MRRQVASSSSRSGTFSSAPRAPALLTRMSSRPRPSTTVVHGLPHLVRPPDVGADDHRAPPERAAAAGRLLDAGQVRVTEHGHVGARFRERDRLGAPDPRRGARHQGDSPLAPRVLPSLMSSSVVQTGPHQAMSMRARRASPACAPIARADSWAACAPECQRAAGSSGARPGSTGRGGATRPPRETRRVPAGGPIGFRLARPRVRVVGVPVEAPLVDRAREVREPEAVRGAGADRRRRRQGPPPRRRARLPTRSARPRRRHGRRAPTRPRSGADGPAGLPGEPVAERDGLDPAHADDRLPRDRRSAASAEEARRRGAGRPQVGAVLGGRHRTPREGERVDPHPPPGPRVRQAVLPAHPEPAGGDRGETTGAGGQPAATRRRARAPRGACSSAQRVVSSRTTAAIPVTRPVRREDATVKAIEIGAVLPHGRQRRTSAP